MTKFRYTAKTLDGVEVQGTRRARNKIDLERCLIQDKMLLDQAWPISVPLFATITAYLYRGEITRITRQLNLLLKNHIPALEAFGAVSEYCRDKRLLAIFQNITARIEAGSSIADALHQHPHAFNKLFVSMVESGESAGELAEAFGRIATYRENFEKVVKKVRSSLTYPILVVLVAVLVLAALMIYVVPVFSSMYANFGAEVPKLTQMVIGASDWLQTYWWLFFFLIIVSTIGSWATYRMEGPRKRIHSLLLKLPIIGSLVQKIVTARFCRTMGALLGTGIEILLALRTASTTTGNLYIESKLQPVELQIAEGITFTDALSRSSVFPKTMLRLVGAGERTGTLSESLLHAAEYFESESEVELTSLTSLIEPLIILVLGVFIAFILVAMYLPLFDLVGTI